MESYYSYLFLEKEGEVFKIDHVLPMRLRWLCVAGVLSILLMRLWKVSNCMKLGVRHFCQCKYS